MLLIVLGVLAAVVVIAVVLVAFQPPAFRVTRSATVAAPPSAVFPHVNDLHAWEDWSPWAKLDPDMKQTYDGPRDGVGAVSAWSGNSKVGEGRMTVTESRPPELLRLKLEFFRPFKATNTAEFTFAPAAGGTTVTWAMTGRKNFIAKAFHLIVDCDRMIGRDFEKGLAQLKSLAESTPTPVVADLLPASGTGLPN